MITFSRGVSMFATDQEIRYEVPVVEIKAAFRARANEHRTVAAEYSKHDENHCSHGIIVMHEREAAGYECRAKYLPDSGVCQLSGGVLEVIFTPVASAELHVAYPDPGAPQASLEMRRF